MERIYFKANENVPKLNGSLLLGYFDGVHKGHQELIKLAKEESDNVGVLLFDTNIAKLLSSSSKGIKELTSLEDKLDISSSFGVNEAYIVQTDLSFLSLNKDEFISQVLKKINPKTIVVGEDYSFGYKGEGNVAYLKNFFNVLSSPLINDKYGKISTRTIRKLIEEGDILTANDELGYEYSLKGRVIHGLENGRKIGFPTANIELDENYVIPKKGVYAGYTYVNDKKYESIINIGDNPTVGSLKRNILETHIINFSEDIYDQNIKVSFLEFLRDEKKFSSFEELKNQLNKDKQYFKK